MNVEVGTQKPNDGDVWNGYEWVNPTRYERQRKTGLKLPNGDPLPPIQKTAADMQQALHEGTIAAMDRLGPAAIYSDEELRTSSRALSPLANARIEGVDDGMRVSGQVHDGILRVDLIEETMPSGSRDTTPPGFTDEERALQHKGDIHHYAWRPGDPRDAVELAARFPRVAGLLGLPGPGGATPVPAYASGGHTGGGIGGPGRKGGQGDERYSYAAQVNPFGEEYILPVYEGRPLIDRALFRSEMDLVDVIHELLQRIDPNPSRSGIAETPSRVAKAWADWTSGYKLNAADILKVFEDGAEHCDEMVVVKDIPVYSHCEHHLAPIFGTATVAYLPNGKIVGLSKLSRLVDMHARRLQVQERMTNSIANDLMEHLGPLGCGVVIKARHMCMESRGVKQAGTITVTSALRGAFKADPAVRAEFLALARQ